MRPVVRYAGPIGLGALALAALVVVAATFYAWHAQRSLIGTLRGTPVVPERSAPALLLVDQNGRRVPLIDPNASATFLFFGYAHCKDTCPLALARLAQAYRSLPATSGVRVEMVTVDPARDDPASLRRFVGRFDPHFIGLTSSKATLAPLWAEFEIVVDARSHDVVHGDGIYLIDRSRHVLGIYPPDVAPADLAHDARIAVR
jgi:protein SCO1/2